MMQRLRAVVSLLFVVVICGTGAASAQKMVERGEVRKGNKAYVAEDYVEAAERYVGALEHSPTAFEAKFNLGCAVAKVDSLADAAAIFEELAADSLLSDAQRSMSYYNLGNSQFGQQQLEQALESYKNAMRFDPSDVEAKYNYAYTKALLDQQQEQEQDQQGDGEGGDGEQDQQQDQQQQDQNEDEQEPDQDQQNQDQDQQEQPQDQQEQQPQPQDGEISQQEREQMLDAIQAQEDKTQDDLKERARGAVVQGVKNW